MMEEAFLGLLGSLFSQAKGGHIAADQIIYTARRSLIYIIVLGYRYHS